LFAIWGGGTLDYIRQAARHKCIKSAEYYYRDSAGLLERAKRNRSPILALCPKWRPNYIENLQAGLSLSNSGVFPGDSKPMHIMASEYISDVLRIKEPKNFDLLVLSSKSETDMPIVSPMNELEELCKTLELSHANTVLITALFDKVVHQRLSLLDPAASTKLTESPTASLPIANLDAPITSTITTPKKTPTVSIPASDSTKLATRTITPLTVPGKMASLPSTPNRLNSGLRVCQLLSDTVDVSSPKFPIRPIRPDNLDDNPSPPKRVRLGGANDLSDRHRLKHLTKTSDKLLVMLEIASSVPSKKSELTNQARTWFFQVLTPTLTCYRDHHDSKLDSFVQKHGDYFSPSRFTKNGCGCVSVQKS
jgi:hypothetical protein